MPIANGETVENRTIAAPGGRVRCEQGEVPGP